MPAECESTTGDDGGIRIALAGLAPSGVTSSQSDNTHDEKWIAGEIERVCSRGKGVGRWRTNW